MSSLQMSPARMAGLLSQGWLIPYLSCPMVHYSVSVSLRTNGKQTTSPLQRCTEAGTRNIQCHGPTTEKKLLGFHLPDAGQFQ